MMNKNQQIALPIRRVFFFLLTVLLLHACSAPKASMGTKTGKKIHQSIEKNNTFNNHYFGLYVVDAETGKEVYKHNAQHHFTPASNTKLLTYYVATSILPEKMPFVDYAIENDTAILWPYGDPEFLNPTFNSQVSLLDSLENLAPHLILSNAQYQDEKYGPGWAWDDYGYLFQTEKSFLPVYGNLISFTLLDTDSHEIKVYPTYFQQWSSHRPKQAEKGFTVVREPFANAFDYAAGPEASANEELLIPMSADKYSLARLLNDTLQNTLSIEDVKYSDYKDKETIYGIDTDSLYREMLVESDNHIAEQLLLASSAVLSDTLKTEIALRHAREKLLTSLPDSFQYVDGSGLSRYNLTTPANMVSLLKKLRKERFSKTIEHLPKGGKSGTIAGMFTNSPIEIYAKTGSLKNTFNLSGYIICESGRILIFSWMNDNFTMPRSELKQQMVTTLTQLYKSY